VFFRICFFLCFCKCGFFVFFLPPLLLVLKRLSLRGFGWELNFNICVEPVSCKLGLFVKSGIIFKKIEKGNGRISDTIRCCTEVVFKFSELKARMNF
jgi:hypothetical protein